MPPASPRCAPSSPRDNLTGFVVPLTDEHMSEYVGGYAQRLAWLTGFDGSAGSAVVLGDKAAIFTDGRYTLQVREQVDGTLYDYVAVPATSTTDWLAANAAAGDRIGYDPWLHTHGWVRRRPRRWRARRDSSRWRRTRSTRSGPTVRPVGGAARGASRRVRGRRVAAKRARIAAWLERAAARRGGRHRARFDRVGCSTSAARTSTTRRWRSPSRWSTPTRPPTCSSTPPS